MPLHQQQFATLLLAKYGLSSVEGSSYIQVDKLQSDPEVPAATVLKSLQGYSGELCHSDQDRRVILHLVVSNHLHQFFHMESRISQQGPALLCWHADSEHCYHHEGKIDGMGSMDRRRLRRPRYQFTKWHYHQFEWNNHHMVLVSSDGVHSLNC